MTDFDYIIVGAGAAGCVAAYRLSADPGCRVLLIEAGGPDRHPFIHMPKGIAKVMADARFIWPFMTRPQPTSNDAPEYWTRGRVLGGSSAVNGMMYVRGQDADFEALADVAGRDWDWPHIGAAYGALERHPFGPSDTRGDSGPLRLSLPEQRLPLIDAAIDAGAALGLKKLEDVNAPADIERVGYAPRTIWRGRRQSASVAFVEPVRQRVNLSVVTGVRIDRLEYEGDRISGVCGDRDGSPVQFRAGREVLLCAGALATPAILQRSGIGPAQVLRDAGIELRVENDGIGTNLREHRGVVMQWRTPEPASQNRQFRGWRMMANGARYFLTHSGPMAGGAYEAGAWFKSDPSQPRPDGQLLFAPFTFDYSSPTFGVEKHGGLNICAYPLRPASTGSVFVTSADPAQLPTIVPNYSALESDRGAMRAAMRYARKLVAQAPLASYAIEETRPGAQFRSDDELDAAHRQFGYGNYHASGSCRMGLDSSSAVDERLRVRGTRGLRVLDTSIFPFMLAGNTNAPAMALAWRACDLILADAG